MTKSKQAAAVDAIQRELRPLLKEHGFRVRGRTFNRTTEDELTQVVKLQMGASPPPGATEIPGYRENLQGLFTVNLGVYVPEVARVAGCEATSWVQDDHCCVRVRLAEACGEKEDRWWPALAEEPVVHDVRRSLERGGLPFLERFATRARIVTEWRDRARILGQGSSPRTVVAILLAARGDEDGAREVLALRAREARDPDRVRELARELGLGEL